ncbi:MAG TPA: hypothetical protein DF613_14830 [Lachnospiraceae bacterium]|nr:hypothetical protein [Lachnospiraceae bacterium]
MQLNLRLGNSTILFLADNYIPWDDRLAAFCASGGKKQPDLTYTIRTAGTLRPDGHHCLKRTPFYQVYMDGQRESWYYTFPDGTVYAACREDSENRFSIWYAEDFLSYLHGNTTLFYLSALEYRMVRRGDMILHASAILDQGQALLFSAPSGMGKSTQAALWQRLRNSRLANGDRVLLHRENDSWLACGWPMAGSSGVSIPYHTPVRALILLDKSSQNTARRLPSGEAWNLVGKEIVLRPWEQTDLSLADGLLRNFCRNTPVYAYSCRKDESAVTALYDVLERDGLYSCKNSAACSFPIGQG